LALTVHFFDEDLVYHSLLFSFRKFSKLHFAKNIRDVIIKEIGNELLEKVMLFKFQSVLLIFFLNRLLQLHQITKQVLKKLVLNYLEILLEYRV
jgi:hypothetical protein